MNASSRYGNHPSVGDLYFLWHSNRKDLFSGYGLVTREGRHDYLTGILMIDRPSRADSASLAKIEEAYGECKLVVMTKAGDRGIACQMRICPESLHLVEPFSDASAPRLQAALAPLLDTPPKPFFRLEWDPNLGVWKSEFWVELPHEILLAFEMGGLTCVPTERGAKIILFTKASNFDVERFMRADVLCGWELIRMPSAPLIRFHALAIGDWGSFTIAETFLDISDSGQTRILSRLADQEELHFDVFGSDCKYRYSKHVGHSREVRQQLNRIVARAAEYRSSLSSDKQGFEAARAEYGASLLNLSPGT